MRNAINAKAKQAAMHWQSYAMSLANVVAASGKTARTAKGGAGGGAMTPGCLLQAAYKVQII